MTTPSPLPRMHMVTLGVADLPRAKAFYRDVFGTDPIGPEGVAFFCLPGVWLGLYPREHLAADIGPEVPTARAPFSGVTIACNAESRAEVDARMAHAEAAGARVVKAPQDTFWGGYSGYFEDLDGYHWELAWGPMFQFDDAGNMGLKP
ncbi:MAG: VOC family protein [Rhodocyclaceae bacterium]|nr:VOC family protein [Rhodocyclaceae bacterium]